MKIVSWNCCCALHSNSKKLDEVLKYDADIYIIQECANPTLYGDERYKRIVGNGFWIGNVKYKGLAVFTTRDDIKLERLDWPDNDLCYFIPVRVNDSFNLLAVWASKRYIEEFYDYKELNSAHLDDNLIMIGDYNSNSVFDKEHYGYNNHTAVVKQLQAVGIEDMYHYLTGEQQGKESSPTFFLYRHRDKAYHIDHCFANPKLVQAMEVARDMKWLELSDHLPIIINTKI